MATGSNGSNRLETADTEEVLALLDAIAKSPTFAAAPRRIQLLRYLVNRTLAGEVVNEYAIGVDVFERTESFDPRTDSIVRTETSRLRQKLKEYHSTQGGSSSRFRIELPLRSYVPIFVVAERTATPVPDPPAELRENTGSPRKIKIGVAVVLAAIVIGAIFWVVRYRARAAAQPQSIAVLPFLNLSGDPVKDYLGDSITDELTGALAEANTLQVVARTSAFQFKNKGADVRQVGRALNATALLEGSVGQQGDRFRIVAQLIRASDGYHLWSQTFDVLPTDLQRVEVEITRSTILALTPSTYFSNRAELIMTTANPEAHDLYLRARYALFQDKPDDLRTAITLAKQAIEKDPSYPLPYETIGTAEGQLALMTLQTQKTACELGAPWIEKAIALNPRFGDAHAVHAIGTYACRWDWPSAEAEFKLAVDLGSRKAHSLYGWSLATRGRFAEAENHFQIVKKSDPLAIGPRQNHAVLLIAQRRYEDARREARYILQLDSRSIFAQAILSWLSLSEQNCPAADSEIRKLTEWYPKLPLTTFTVAWSAAACGRPEDARRYLAQVDHNVSPGTSFYQLALISATLADADRTFTYLRQAAENREQQIMYLKNEPLFDKFRGDPRLVSLERQVGLLSPN
jgi:adenylate cyclase